MKEGEYKIRDYEKFIHYVDLLIEECGDLDTGMLVRAFAPRFSKLVMRYRDPKSSPLNERLRFMLEL